MKLPEGSCCPFGRAHSSRSAGLIAAANVLLIELITMAPPYTGWILRDSGESIVHSGFCQCQLHLRVIEKAYSRMSTSHGCSEGWLVGTAACDQCDLFRKRYLRFRVAELLW